jgi:hypothetical protein
MLEFVQATGLVKGIQTGAEVQVIGIAQNDLGLDILFQIPVIHSLHGTHRAHRHEDGGEDFSVVGRNLTCAGGAGRIVGYLLEFEHPSGLNIQKYGKFCKFA